MHCAERIIAPQAYMEHSGFLPRMHNVRVVKRAHYDVLEGISISGDAPKEFVRMYAPGLVPKRTPSKWPVYIAKLGHKYYPMESITEHLLNRIGQELGFRVADSELMCIGGQVRFMSRYFLRLPLKQNLEHGASLYARLTSLDEVHQREAERKGSGKYFSVQFTQEALKSSFPHHAQTLFQDFTRMLLFDAIVGNNDRHIYNWGVVVDMEGKEEPRYAPIYDTASGLFWNRTEAQLGNWRSLAEMTTSVKRYADGSMSRIGWDDTEDLDHFSLIAKVIGHPWSLSKEEALSYVDRERLEWVLRTMAMELQGMFSPKRWQLIEACLRYRQETLWSILH